MKIREIEIPVPWGHVAAKVWGEENNPAILAVHGWTDNANTFDELIPLLPESYYYVCIDLPSHGKSSELPASPFVHQTDFIVVLKLVYDYLNRKKLILLTHSMGGFVALSFAQFFPQCLAKLIVFDAYFYYPKSPANAYKKLGDTIKSYVAVAKLAKAPPTYTKDEAVRRLMAARMTPISRKTAEILTERGVVQLANGRYRFTVPHNIREIIVHGQPIAALVEIAKKYPIQCPHLLILSRNSSVMRSVFKDVHREYERNNHFEFHIVDGNHEVHLENPERVAPIVCDFLLKNCSKL